MRHPSFDPNPSGLSCLGAVVRDQLGFGHSRQPDHWQLWGQCELQQNSKLVFFFFSVPYLFTPTLKRSSSEKDSDLTYSRFTMGWLHESISDWLATVLGKLDQVRKVALHSKRWNMRMTKPVRDASEIKSCSQPSMKYYPSRNAFNVYISHFKPDLIWFDWWCALEPKCRYYF